MSLLLNDVKKHYKLLQHDGYYSQLHAQDKQNNKLLDRRLVKGENDIIGWVKKFNGRGDLYIGRNPRQENGDVAYVSNICIDIDPIRPKDTAATQEQLQEAITAGKRLLEIPLYSQGIIACSGNGCHIYFPVKKEWNITQDQVQAFETDIRNLTEEKYNVNVDAIHDSPRLVKIIGTQATKGNPELHRVSRFLSPIHWGRLFDDSICRRLTSYTGAQQPRDAAELLKEGHIDRSQFDFRTALQLKKDGFGDDYIRAYLFTAGLKTRNRKDDVERIIRKLSDYRGGHTSSQSSPDQQPESIERIEVFTPSSHTGEFLATLEREGKEKSGLTTGFPTLDRYTSGLKKGSIWVVGARTGIGKTSFSLTVANHLLNNHHKVLIFSTEMDWLDAFGRFASIGTGISLHKITNAKRELTSEDRRKIGEYARTFESLPLYVVQEPEPSLRVVSEEISRIQPDVFIFDHIQRVSTSSDKRYLELAKFIKGLNTLCRKFNCAGIVNSQLNRIAEKEVPSLSHLKECGALEEEAHAVILLSNLSTSPNANSVVLADIAKNRGQKGRVELILDGSTAEFREGNNS